MLEIRNMLKGSMLLLFASVFARGSMLLFRYLAAITISPDDYGRLSLYISLFLSMATIASFGVGGSLAKLAVNEKGCTDGNYISLYGNSIILTLFTTIIATGAFAFALKQASSSLFSNTVVAATAVGFLFWSYFQISIGFSLARLRFNLASMYEAGDGVIKLLLVLLAWFLFGTPNLDVFIFSFCLGYFLLTIWAAVNNCKLLVNTSCINPFKSFDMSKIGGLASHSSALMIITFATLFYGFVLRSFLAASSNVDVALFDMALTFYSVPKMVFVSLVRPIVPFAARRAGARITVPPIARFIYLFFVVMVAAIVLHVVGFTGIIFKYIGLSAYLDSFPVFIVLMFGALFDLGFGFLSSYLQGAGKVRVVSVLAVFTFILTLPISFYAVKSFGVYGAAVVNVVFNSMLAIATALAAKRLLGFERAGGLKEVSY
jgi:O-antigen/teichoic acid export membrane protein